MYDKKTRTIKTGDENLFDEFVDDNTCWLWMDLCNESHERELALLNVRLGIHELALSDARRPRHPPKFEAFSDHIFLLLRGLAMEAPELQVDTIQVAIFLKRNLVITRHTEDSSSIEKVWNDVLAGTIKAEKGPSHLASKVGRYIVDRYTPLLLDLEDDLDEFEDLMLERPDDKIMGELIATNARLKKLRRTLAYQETLFFNLSHSDLHIWGPHFRHECIDIYEQFERAASLSTLYQGLISDLINGYLGISAHRLNQIMKILTLVTVVFLPLTVIVGIYGMNFDNMPELHWHYGYYACLGVMLAVILSSVFVVRKLRWL